MAVTHQFDPTKVLEKWLRGLPGSSLKYLSASLSCELLGPGRSLFFFKMQNNYHSDKSGVCDLGLGYGNETTVLFWMIFFRTISFFSHSAFFETFFFPAFVLETSTNTIQCLSFKLE